MPSDPLSTPLKKPLITLIYLYIYNLFNGISEADTSLPSHIFESNLDSLLRQRSKFRHHDLAQERL